MSKTRYDWHPDRVDLLMPEGSSSVLQGVPILGRGGVQLLRELHAEGRLMGRALADAEKLESSGEWRGKEAPPMSRHYEGPPEDDEAERVSRLQGQTRDVYRALLGGAWLTLGELAEKTGHPEASISAQLRHLRKPRFGGYTIEKEHRGRGLYAYRLVADEVRVREVER